ncbi:hypothetical protein EIN_469310, partial [Entamoeba invadens IP1]
MLQVFVSLFILGFATCWKDGEKPYLTFVDQNSEMDSYCTTLGITISDQGMLVTNMSTTWLVLQNVHMNVTVRTTQSSNLEHYLFTKWNCNDFSNVENKFDSSLSSGGETGIALRQWNEVLSLNCINGLKFTLLDSKRAFYIEKSYSSDSTSDHMAYYPIYFGSDPVYLTVTIHNINVIPKTYVIEELRCVFFASATNNITENIFYLEKNQDMNKNVGESAVQCNDFQKRYICHNSSVSIEKSKCMESSKDWIDKGNYEIDLVYQYIKTGLSKNVIEKDLKIINYLFEKTESFEFDSNKRVEIENFENVMQNVIFSGSGQFYIENFHYKTIEVIKTKGGVLLEIAQLQGNVTFLLQGGENTEFTVKTLQYKSGDISIENVDFDSIVINNSTINNISIVQGIVNTKNNIQIFSSKKDEVVSLFVDSKNAANTLPPITFLDQNIIHVIGEVTSNTDFCVDVASTIPGSQLSVVESQTVKMLSQKRLIRFCKTLFDDSVLCHMNATIYEESYVKNFPFTLPHCPCDGEKCTISILPTKSVNLNNKRINAVLQLTSEQVNIVHTNYIYNLATNLTKSVALFSEDVELGNVNENVDVINEAGNTIINGKIINNVTIYNTVTVTNENVTINTVKNVNTKLFISKSVKFFQIYDFGDQNEKITLLETEETTDPLVITLQKKNYGFVEILSRRPITLNANMNNISIVSDTRISYSISIVNSKTTIVITKQFTGVSLLKTTKRTLIGFNKQNTNKSESLGVSLEFSTNKLCKLAKITDDIYSCEMCDFERSDQNEITKECEEI